MQRPKGYTSWRIGDVKLTRIVELASEKLPHWGYQNLTPEQVIEQSWLRPHFATEDGKLKSCIQAFVIETPDLRIIVDTCIGNDKARKQENWNGLQTRFLDDLAASGYPPESIDIVLCTHLHVDHVGWNTRLVDGEWVPTFTNARYLFGKDEWAHWSQEITGAREGDITPEVFANVMEQSAVNADSVQPIIDAGLHELVEDTHELCPEVSLFPTPGHTPGHVSVSIRSGEDHAVITGDLMHHPIQCAMPHVASKFDHDVARAQDTRRAFLRRFADGPVMVFGTHFREPNWGRIITVGDTWQLEVQETPD